MPRFYFDLDDGTGIRRDGEGVELPDLGNATLEAIRLLPTIAWEQGLGSQRLRALLRDDAGEILEVTLSLEVKQLR